ncbi:Hypothetical protein A7982_01330 [Minicystis rosea]|nr:Hypothetical protein A7982_01330 [Minicystis rosea]
MSGLVDDTETALGNKMINTIFPIEDRLYEPQRIMEAPLRGVHASGLG